MFTATKNLPTTTNGIDTQVLKQYIDQVSEDPAAGMTSWDVTSRWKGGTRIDHTMETIMIGDTPVQRHFELRTDEPFELCGSNKHPNPQEYLLSAINACMMVGYSAVAALMGIELTKLEINITGDIDLRGFLGIDPDVANGYEQLKQVVRIDGNATPEQIEELHQTVLNTSPNFFNITKAVPTHAELQIG